MSIQNDSKKFGRKLQKIGYSKINFFEMQEKQVKRGKSFSVPDDWSKT